MHERPRRILRQLIRHYGPALCADPKRVEAFLQDLCGQYYREIFILVHAQEQGVPEELLSAGSLAGEQALWQRLSRRLQERLALTAEAAHWAVESWALALDVAPLHYRYPRLLRLFIDALARFEPAAMGRALWQFMQTGGRSLHDNGVQWFGWKRSGSNARQFTLDRFRAGRWIGATLLVLVLLSTAAVAYQANSTEALTRSLFFWQRPGHSLAGKEPLLPDQAAVWLADLYPLPQIVRIDAEQVAVYTTPEANAQIVALLSPPGAAVTMDRYTADGRWAHLSDPVQGWIEHTDVLHMAMAQGEASYPVHVAPAVGVVTTAGLRVRSGPNLEASILGELDEGERVLVLAITLDRRWFQIVEPIQGWVSSDYVMETGTD